MSVLEGKTDAEVAQEWADIHKHSVPKKTARLTGRITLEADSVGEFHYSERVDDMRGFKHQHKKRIRIIRKETGRNVFDTGWVWQSGGLAKFAKAKGEIKLMDAARRENK